MFWLLLTLPLDLAASITTPAEGLEVKLETPPGRYRITHTWRGKQTMRFVTGSTDRNCDEPVDVLLTGPLVMKLHSNLPCGGFAYRAARVVKPGESWVIEGNLDDSSEKYRARYCVTQNDLKAVDPKMTQVKEPPWWMGCEESGPKRESVSASRATSPWKNDEETAIAGKVLAGWKTVERLRAYAVDGEQMIGTDSENRRVIINDRWFGDMKRVNATSLPKGKRHALGTVKSAPWPWFRLVRFLVESDLVETYVHIGSQLELTELEDSPGRYRARLDGTHEFYTNQRNVQAVRFIIEVDKASGRIEVVGD
jgi:hypothetical protein